MPPDTTHKLPQASDAQRIGARGEALAEAELSNIAVCNKMSRDYGLDFLCHLLEGATVTARAFFVQVKTFAGSYRETTSLSVKVSSLQHWCASTIPVYIVLCFLRGTPRILWLNAAEVVAREFGSFEALLAKNHKSVSVGVDKATPFNLKAPQSLVKHVKAFSSRLDDSIQAMLSLRQLPSNWISNEAIPLELETLGADLKYYFATPPATRAALIETYFDTWEKISNRFAYGYPVGNLSIAFYMTHCVALRCALKALYYMESDVIHMMHEEMTYVRDHLDYRDRVHAFRDSLISFHCTPYVRNEMFDDIVAGKIAAIACWIFEPARVVPTLKRLRSQIGESLGEVWHRNRRASQRAAPNMGVAIPSALEKLRWFKTCDPIIPAMAIDTFDRDIATGRGWRWEQRVHIISYHTLYEPRSYRPFDSMLPTAKKLILDGLRRHPDPLVRLDCLKVYNTECVKHGLALKAYIEERKKAATEPHEVDRLDRIYNALEKFLQEQVKNKKDGT